MSHNLSFLGFGCRVLAWRKIFDEGFIRYVQDASNTLHKLALVRSLHDRDSDFLGGKFIKENLPTWSCPNAGFFSVLIGVVLVWYRGRAYRSAFEELLYDLAGRVGYALGVVFDLHTDLDHYWRSFVPLDLEKSRNPLQNGKSTFLKVFLHTI